LHLDCVGSKSGIFPCVFKVLLLARISVLEGSPFSLVRLL
jgi:hypothetical protein